jgi:hypothetical protein
MKIRQAGGSPRSPGPPARCAVWRFVGPTVIPLQLSFA